jgi:hypothetical protein
VWRALGFKFDLTTDDALALRYCSRLFESLDRSTKADGCFVIRAVDGFDGGRWELFLDGEVRAEGGSLEGFATSLVTELNAKAAASWPGVVCHAGGVSTRGQGILLPAEPESGKSTLTCGLVRAGFRYLSDEGVAFHPGTNRIEPYPKPITLDRGSWFLFPELEPHEDFESDDYKRDQWQVPPTAIRPDAVGGPCRARLIVFPKYVEGATTELAPMGRAEALVELAKNTFSFNQRSRAALEELAVVVRACDCYRLTVGDLDSAIAVIRELAETLPPAAEESVTGG